MKCIMRTFSPSKEISAQYENQVSSKITSNPLMKNSFTYYEYTNWINKQSKFTMEEYNRYNKNKNNTL